MVSPERPELGVLGFWWSQVPTGVCRRIGESLTCRAEMRFGGHVLTLLGHPSYLQI